MLRERHVSVYGLSVDPLATSMPAKHSESVEASQNARVCGGFIHNQSSTLKILEIIKISVLKTL